MASKGAAQPSPGLQVRFWGTRGSIATPGLDTARFGGNTSCVEVRSGDDLAILDCGTGVRALGASLMTLGKPVSAHLLLSHIHWDHIQGFPFFTPLFLPGSEVAVYGAAGLEQSLEEAMSGQMQYTYFPVRLAELRSRLAFREVGECTFKAGVMTVRAQYLNHTCPALGYRLSAGGASVAYMTDHEPFWPHNPDAPLEEALVHPGDRRHVAFLSGVDLLIHDAQYTAEEYPARRGWGHSTVEYVVDVAVAAGARRLALFHHDPGRTDEDLVRLVDRARERAVRRGSNLVIFAAAEKQVIDLQGAADAAEEETAAELSQAVRVPRVALVGSADRRRALREALVEDGYLIVEAEPREARSVTLAGEPDVVVVLPPSGKDPVAMVQAVGVSLPGRTLMAVLAQGADEALLRRLGTLADDVLATPFGQPTLRARVRACLSRRPVLTRRAPPEAGESLRVADRLTVAELRALLRSGMPCTFRPGDVLFEEGAPTGGVYYLHRGRVEVRARGSHSQAVTLGHAGPGDTVGEMSALDGAPRSASVVALERVEATHVPREAFRRALERSPRAAVRMLGLLVQRLRDLNHAMAQVALPPERNVEHETQGAWSVAAVQPVQLVAPRHVGGGRVRRKS